MQVLIKRYANRKLYNTQTSRYITLKGIAELMEAGADVSVIDNESGEDITEATLGQIRVDRGTGNRELPRTLLTDLFQKGGDALYGALKRGVGDASDSLEGLQRNVRQAMRSREQGVHRVREQWSETREELKHDFDEAVHTAVERVFKSLDLPRRSDLLALNERLERVAEALESLESRRRHRSEDAET